MRQEPRHWLCLERRPPQAENSVYGLHSYFIGRYVLFNKKYFVKGGACRGIGYVGKVSRRRQRIQFAGFFGIIIVIEKGDFLWENYRQKSRLSTEF